MNTPKSQSNSLSLNRVHHLSSAYRRSKIDPAWFRGFSGELKSYAADVKSNLRPRRATRRLSERMSDCGFPYKRGYPWAVQCRSVFCPACSSTHISKRQGKAIGLYDGTPKSSVYFATVLLGVTPSMFDRPYLPTRSDVRLPEWKDRRDLRLVNGDMREIVSEGRKRLRKSLIRSRNESIAAIGGLDFELCDWRSREGQKGAFVNASANKQRLQISENTIDVWVPHFHFVVSVNDGTEYLNRDMISQRLKNEFDLPYQVMVKPLKLGQAKEQALAACTTYGARQKTKGMRPPRVRELGLLLHSLTRRGTSLTWQTGSFRKPH